MLVFICKIIIALSIIAYFLSMAISFVKYNNKNSTKKSKRSIKTHIGMILLNIIYFSIIYFKLGVFDFNNLIFIIAGTILVVVGTVLNISARLSLKENWANEIKIYKEHTLITSGIYKIVRHPLYSSVILMMFGGSLAYRNWLSLVPAVVILIPFYYQSKQEEIFLREEFAKYKDYQKNTAMFFPKLFKIT
jgi:protein-S-isoprenylcysteine O-methyltransferase Ste14